MGLLDFWSRWIDGGTSLREGESGNLGSSVRNDVGFSAATAISSVLMGDQWVLTVDGGLYACAVSLVIFVELRMRFKYMFCMENFGRVSLQESLFGVHHR